MDAEDYATNDTSRGGACLTDADIEELEGESIEHVVACAQERRAYFLLKRAEEHLEAVTEHWNACQTRMWATKRGD